MFLNTKNKINISLCGMMGAGKSVIGKILAKKIDFAFFDTDMLIEKKAKRSINDIFQDNGEKHFRNCWTQIEKCFLFLLSNVFYC